LPSDEKPRRSASKSESVHLRLLLTGEPFDDALLQQVVDTVIDGIARRKRSR
jgi:hypothetical protein